MHFTPTGSSWINQVERWFGYLTDQLVRRGVHKSVQALEKDIRAWMDQWNDDPKPFVWTKTAEEILESLAKYCRRIFRRMTLAVCRSGDQMSGPREPCDVRPYLANDRATSELILRQERCPLSDPAHRLRRPRQIRSSEGSHRPWAR
jgi:hypothetical protein